MTNDMVIIFVLLVFFLGLGGILPFLQQDLEQETITNYTVDSVIEDTGLAQRDSDVSIFEVFISMIKIFYWTFGDLPFLVDLLILTPLRLTFVLTIARNVWIGGGG